MTVTALPLLQRPASTPAVLGLLTIATGLPYFLITVYFLNQALAQPDAAAVTHLGPMTLLRNLMAAICIVLGAQAAWLWWHRRDPAPRYYSSLCIVLLSVVALVTIGLSTGSYNSPTVLMAILALVVGLALQPRRIVMYGFILSLVLLISYQVLARAGVVSYMPVFAAGTFVAQEPVAWWRHLRDVLVYGGLLQGLFLIFWLFSRVDRQTERLAEMARSDILTGTSDRAWFLQQLQVAVARRDRDGRSFTLVLCNLDWFRLINDSYGHVAGDNVLRTLGAILIESCGPADVAARLGGDEFALILTDSNPEQVRRQVDRLRLDVLGQRFQSGEKEFRVTISIGMVDCAAGDSDRLLAAAQSTLRRAKESGRNRIETGTCTGAPA